MSLYGLTRKGPLNSPRVIYYTFFVYCVFTVVSIFQWFTSNSMRQTKFNYISIIIEVIPLHVNWHLFQGILNPVKIREAIHAISCS